MQTPAPVDYARATSVEHALRLLAELGPESRLIAGGHSLLPMMRLRLAQPDCVIDINDLSDLDYIRVDGEDLAIGAMTRHASLLASPVAGEHYPVLH
ncbi:MAG: FAD binding domain-containing protein, partial [Actinomycetes bacterium]